MERFDPGLVIASMPPLTRTTRDERARWRLQGLIGSVLIALLTALAQGALTWLEHAAAPP